jgi:hypothetical protein
MEKLTLSGVGAFLLVVWWKLKVLWAFWSPVIEKIVEEIEERSKDGVIDLKDRKEIALKAINFVAQKTGKKIGLLEKLLISWLIDKYAGKLIPHDIVIPKIVGEATNGDTIK